MNVASRSVATARDAGIALRLLTGERDEMDALQRVLEAAPSYAERVTGAPPGPADAQSTFTMLPDGKGYDDKFVFAIELDDEMVGCIDLVRGYPDASTAIVGLLLLTEACRRRGIGTRAYRLVEEVVRSWGRCDRMRIAVLRANDEVLAFWHALGFVENGETKPYRYGPVVSELVVLTKPLDRSIE